VCGGNWKRLCSGWIKNEPNVEAPYTVGSDVGPTQWGCPSGTPVLVRNSDNGKVYVLVPTLACDVAPLDEYDGMVYHVSQESTLYGGENYTYNIAVGSDIEQETGPTNGNKKYSLGTHKSYDGETEEFGDGDKCGGTRRSATVSYTFGNKPLLLRASEVSTCKYEFEIQLPHAVSAFTGRTYTVENQTSTLHGSGSRYTYTVEVGGDIIQQTNNAGDFTVGKHTSFSGEKEYFENGDSCEGSKKRSATVTYSYGSKPELISAEEPETCVYEFKIQLPEQDCR
jgi:hypothetical protein